MTIHAITGGRQASENDVPVRDDLTAVAVAAGVIRQWTVQTPHEVRLAVFEEPGQAWEYAAIHAGADAPSVMRAPDGRTHLVFRYSDLCEISTRHRFVGTTRRVVDL